MDGGGGGSCGVKRYGGFSGGNINGGGGSCPPSITGSQFTGFACENENGIKRK